MGHAYTPGLTVSSAAVVRKTRRLPLTGSVVARLGQEVKAGDVVARTELPGNVHLINLANALSVLPDELEPTLRVAPGESIQRGQLLAEHRFFFGLMRNQVHAPITGALETVSTVTGQAVLREPPNRVEVTAYIDGTVVEEIAGEGVVIEAHAAMVQGIFGLAGEVHAPIAVVARGPDVVLDADDLDASHQGKVVLGGARATLAAMRRAMELGVAAVVSGGFAYQDVRELLGYDVGVAVTGTEPLPTTLIVTEGFGDIAMARATYELLAGHEGRHASVTGATQIRAGVIRPEVVIPLRQAALPAAVPQGGQRGLDVGASVRCIRAPHFGRIGTVVGLPAQLCTMSSETVVRVLAVDLGAGEPVIVPRANVEVIEQ